MARPSFSSVHQAHRYLVSCGEGRWLAAKLDPAKSDAAAKPKRKRKARNRPEPSAELRAKESDMEKRVLARPHPPGIMLEPAGYDEEHWTAPHADRDLWTLQLAEAFGTRSMSVIHAFIRQLEKLCDSMEVWDEEAHQWRMDEHQLNAALAIVSSTRPENEMEAALAAQMVAVHLMTMKTAARAVRYDYEPRMAAVAGKLARTFNDQLRVMQDLKGRKKPVRQSIKVKRESHHHQHIHVHREGAQNDGQPQATDGGERRSERAGEPAERPALPSPSEVHGEVVSLASRKRKAGV
jgi:hypothetical protein